MTDKQAPRRKVASSLLSAAIVLVAAAIAHPSFAATGTDARCDQSMDGPPMSPADQGELAIEIVDRGKATALATDALSLDGPDGETLDQPMTLPPMLSISGEAGNRSMPLAVEKTEDVDKPSPVVEADRDDVTAELPGLSRDDLVRYRQQMYRRDI